MSLDGPGSSRTTNSSTTNASNIRVFVHWQDSQTVFAGEQVKCTITFRNVAHPAPSVASQGKLASPAQPRQAKPSSLHHGQGSGLAKTESSGTAPPSAVRSHRSTLSLTVPSGASASRGRAGSVPWSPNVLDSRPPSSSSARNGHGHKRSVSILSIGSAATTVEDRHSNAGSVKSQRPGRGHARASSLQIVPTRGSPTTSGSRSATYPPRPNGSQPSPLFNASYPPDRSTFDGRLSGASTVPNTPRVGSSIKSPRSGADAVPNWRFPSLSRAKTSPAGLQDEPMSPASAAGDTASLAMRPKDAIPTITEHAVAPAMRILSTTSIAGTPRSSGEFYSLSNNSSETLASEYVTQQPLRTNGRPPHFRRPSNFSPVNSARTPETLMMGYAQIQGSFTLDGSLVKLGPFEQVKKKAVVGGHGGGVIGIDNTRRDGGLLKSLGWGSFTSSIGELLGGGELSSIREMRGIASSKSIPLLSTPQSILFVDLRLGPGESRTFEYAFTLPKGLPPTHRGKAMKISYSLVIGTQRPGGAKEQQVKSVDIPFRVLGSVNNYGEILGHDLMSPYVILRDQARVRTLEKGYESRAVTSGAGNTSSQPKSTVNSFLSYVDELLARSDNGVSGGLLSPTATPSSRRPSSLSPFDEGGPFATTSAREAIDLAILRANLTGAGQQSANRFEIARNGRRVGVVMLARPAYRLGEVVAMAVDFAGAEIPCYAVHAALETAETVDPSLALRSEASVHRVTRKVFVSASEAALFARRVVFAPAIPVSATPEFVTSGVSLEWKIRLEFVVPAQDYDHAAASSPFNRNGEEGGEEEEQQEQEREEEGDDDDDDNEEGEGEDRGVDQRGAAQRQRGGGTHSLLEEISRDDRGGLVLVAAENLVCESFEVAVPLRVYGAVCTGLERLERDEAMEEGLAV